MQNNHLKKRRSEDDVIRLSELNARDTTIASLTGLTLTRVKQIVSHIHGRIPPKGRGVGSIKDYINNKKHQRHVSFIVSAYVRLKSFGIDHVESVIQSYLLYQATLVKFSDRRSFVDIDHAYTVIHEANKSNDYKMFDCNSCRSKFFSYKYELPINCPFCSDKREQKNPITKASKAA